MENTVYLNDLLRGREISLGLPTPPIDLSQRIGRENKLRMMWLYARPQIRDMISRVVGSQDQLIKEFDEGRA